MSEEKSKLLCQCPKQSSETKKIYVTLCGHRVICRTLITNENFNTRSFWCVKSKIEAHNRRYVVRETKENNNYQFVILWTLMDARKSSHCAQVPAYASFISQSHISAVV